MVKRVDPDDFTAAVDATATTEEVEIQTAAKTIELRVAGNLDDLAPGRTSGATGKAIYSFLKEEWLANATLRRFKFPIKMIFEGSFIWVNGWAPANQQTRDLFRDAGFQEQVSGNLNACMISLGSMDDANLDLAYYVQATGFTAATTDFDKTGELNENVDITAATTYFKAFLREPNKVFGEYDLLGEQGLSALTFQAYSFPLVNSDDLKATETDANVGSQAPYTGMSVDYLQGVGFTTAAAQAYSLNDVIQDGAGRWAICTTAGTLDAAGAADYTANGGTGVFAAYHGEAQIGASFYAFNRIINANGGTDIQAYTFGNFQLRQAGNINNDGVLFAIPAGQGGYGTVNGAVAELLGEYVGDTLKLKPGVLLRGFDTNSTNNIVHNPINVDSGGLDSNGVPLFFTETPYPFVAAGNFNISQNLVDEPDVDTVLTAYFEQVNSVTSTGIAITGVSGLNATLDYTAAAAGVQAILNTLTNTTGGADDASADVISIAGFTTGDNNGLAVIAGAPAANTVAITYLNANAVPANEVAGDSVTVRENPFESTEAIVVRDNSNTPIDFQITAATIAWDFDYTNNNQGGRPANTPAAIHIVAIAKDGGEWADATHTITAATGQNIPVNANDERNYSNPV